MSEDSKELKVRGSRRMLTFDEVEPRKDPDLSIQAYYARLNPLSELLSPLSRELLFHVWEATGTREKKEVNRSTIVGILVGDLIRALDLREVTSGTVQRGQWFVHTGPTYFTRQGHDRKRAVIRLGDRQITAVVRRDCEITGTADANMDGKDEISIVIGRLLTDDKFDLVVAGYRHPAIMTIPPDTRTIVLGEARGPVLDCVTYRDYPGDVEMRYEGQPDATVLEMAAMDAFDYFKAAVEREGTWKLLYDPAGQPARESWHQELFRLVARFPFAQLGIKIMPGADHGSGQTDLTLVLRDAVLIIEFKKDYDLQRVIHGLNVQLPMYMRSAAATSGIFAVMCHMRDPGDVAELLSKQAAQAQDGIRLAVETVDCRRRVSASRAP
jgi:hypothetical protein